MNVDEQADGGSSPADPKAHPEAERGRSRRRFLGLRTAAAIVAAVLAALISYLALGNLRTAGDDIASVAPLFVWTLVGPHLVLVSVVAVALCLPLWLARRRLVLRAIASSLAVLALISSATITAILVNTAHDLGGSVNLARALTLSTPSQAPDEVTTYLTVDGQAQQARVFLPETGAQDAPVLMYVHGGAWYMGSAEASDSVAAWWASQGYYVVNVDYRLASATNPTWDKAPADVACALTWTVQQADLAGADSQRLTLMGDSAGGHLAMLAGWSASQQAATSSCPELGAVPVPDAVVAGYPVSNIAYTYDHGESPLGLDTPGFISDFLGGSPSSQPEHLAAVSPSTYLSPSVPPTLVLQPEGDTFIPAEGNYQTVEQARRAGAAVTLDRVPFAYHGFDLLQGGVGGQIKNTVALNWLEELDLAP